MRIKNQNIDRLNHADITNPLLLQQLREAIENFYKKGIESLNIEIAVREDVCMPPEIELIKFYEFRKMNPEKPITEIWQEVFGTPANKALERDLKNAGDV